MKPLPRRPQHRPWSPSGRHTIPRSTGWSSASKGVPSSSRTRYVKRLVADGSGARVRIAGRAILRVRFGVAQAHDQHGRPTVARRTAFGLPNVMTAVRSGDFEAVT